MERNSAEFPFAELKAAPAAAADEPERVLRSSSSGQFEEQPVGIQQRILVYLKCALGSDVHHTAFTVRIHLRCLSSYRDGCPTNISFKQASLFASAQCQHQSCPQGVLRVLTSINVDTLRHFAAATTPEQKLLRSDEEHTHTSDTHTPCRCTYHSLDKIKLEFGNLNPFSSIPLIGKSSRKI